MCSEHVTVVVLAGLCCCYLLKYSSLHTELVVLSCFLDTRVAFFSLIIEFESQISVKGKGREGRRFVGYPRLQ